MPKPKKNKPSELLPPSLLASANDSERAEILRLLAEINQPSEATPEQAGDDRICKTQGELAAALGVSVAAVSQWVLDPTFPGKPGVRGKAEAHFPVGEIRRWREQRSGASSGKDRAANESTQRKRAAEAALKELEFERRAGRLVDRDQAESIYAATVATARSLLEELPDVLASSFPADRPKLRKRIANVARRHVHKVLDALAGDLLKQEESEAAEIEAT